MGYKYPQHFTRLFKQRHVPARVQNGKLIVMWNLFKVDRQHVAPFTLYPTPSGSIFVTFAKKTIMLMKNFIWIALLLASCSPVYVPNVRNPALFRGAGEVQVSGHFGDALDGQAAISVTNHIGISGAIKSVNRTSDDNDKYVKHRFWEGGVGYYENASNERICYEIFGGYGRGEGTAYNEFNKLFGASADDIKATGKYQRFYIQPSIGSNHRIFNWIVSARVSLVDFESFTSNGVVVTYNDPEVFFEPAFTGRVNFGKIPIYSQFQVGFNVNVQGSSTFDYQPSTLAFGIGLRLGGGKKIVTQQ
jgi:hypothetical protein